MAQRANQFKSNSFKNESSGKQNMNRFAGEKKSRLNVLPSMDLQDGRFIKILGLFFVVLSLYFLIAFTSYLFTWQEDQSYVIDANGGWSNLFKSAEELKTLKSGAVVQNWLGKFGALLSHQFIYEWFGLASFLFVLVFFVIGYRLLFKVKIFALEKTFGYSLFFLLFISLSFGFGHAFFGEAPHFLEGEFGYWTNKLLTAQIGVAGVAGLIAFLGLSILIIAYNIDFKIPEIKRRERDVTPDSTPLEDIVEDEVSSKPVEFDFNTNKPLNTKRPQNVVLLQKGNLQYLSRIFLQML